MTELTPQPAIDAPVICGAEAASCTCALSPGHDGPHHCQRDNCGGSWLGTIDQDDFEPIRYPGWLA